jgi:hypothetical protein
MRFHLLPDPWLETEVAHLEDASAVDFKVVFFLEAGRHRFLVEILVFGARQSVSPLMDPRYLYLVALARRIWEIPPGNNSCCPRLVLLLLAHFKNGNPLHAFRLFGRACACNQRSEDGQTFRSRIESLVG